MKTRIRILPRQKGMTLAETLVTLALSALIMAALAGVVDTALAAQGATREENDLHTAAQFALGRIAATVANTPYKQLPPKADDTTSGSWLAPAYAWANGSVTESDGATSRVIVTDVAAFSITSPPVSAGRPYIVVSITLSGKSTQLTSTTAARIGGAT